MNEKARRQVAAYGGFLVGLSGMAIFANALFFANILNLVAIVFGTAALIIGIWLLARSL